MADTELIRQAIVANLRAREQIRRQREHEREVFIGPTQPPTIQWLDLTKPFSSSISKLEEIIGDATIAALRAQMKMLGKMLFDEVRSTDEMRDIAEAIAVDFTGNWGWAIDVMDKNWDGVGAGSDIWRA